MIIYNTALYQGIDLFGDVPNPPRREDRRDAIIRELKREENNADIVCLQEVRGVFQKYAERFHRMFAIAARLMIFHVKHAWYMLIKYR